MKKQIIAGMAAAMICVGAIGGTFAWLTNTSTTVTNTFSVGQVGITLDEAKVDPYGVATQNTERVTANTYKLIPGHTYKKDPVVHVAANSEKCWVFVKVENEIADIEADSAEIASQITAQKWTAYGGDGVYYYKENVEAGEAGADLPVFETFKVNGNVDNTTLNGYSGKTIKITACAVQADGLTTVDDAFKACPSAFNGETTSTTE